MNVVDVTAGAVDLLPPVCRECSWWQSDRPSRRTPGWRVAAPTAGALAPQRDAALRATWEQRVTREARLFGKALVDQMAVVGWLQAAPARFVPRASGLPAGPPSTDAWLITCAYFYDQEYLHGFQRLLNELQADLKQREVVAVEAFAVCGTALVDRFRGYLRELNLFNYETLEGSGFRPVRLAGEVALYRLELAGLVAEPRLARVAAHAETFTAAQPV
jgi:hypothetical protein